ncbi:MAG TPA: phage tail sheath C-terminal domain-containing protein [Gammaproteobacteria bacterium]
MSPSDTRKTPGVYVTEHDAFPSSIVGVETAIPAFIGYTEKAEIDGETVYNRPVKIESLADFISIFGVGFRPVYRIEEAAVDAADSGSYDFKISDPNKPAMLRYFVLTQITSRFNLYNSMRLFYANGGESCYVVSVGDYTDGGQSLSGVSIGAEKLSAGLAVIEQQRGPTMLAIPDAVLLDNDGAGAKPWESSEYQAVTRAMLEQCGRLQDRVAILDVYGSEYADNKNLTAVIRQFGINAGDQALSYGMSYFPFLETTVGTNGDFSYMNIDQPQTKLAEILTWESRNLYGADTARSTAVQAEIEKMADTRAEPAVTRLNQNLMASLPLLADILDVMVAKNRQLPPSAAMAGVYTLVDNDRGVWNAPANVSLSSVSGLSYKLNDEQQGNLNVPLDGKAVNAIREFVGRGVVVWGARTLDGNSNDWRYIQVRRTIIYVEQSIKNALAAYAFAANDRNTWAQVTAGISVFLQGLWSRGGLMGSTASEAFTVQCGLGSTMTGQEILDGYMIVQVTLQLIRPAEFIELTFKQEMQGAS